MKEKENGYQGSELHRLKPMQEGYDQDMFNRLYKICKPVIRRLTSQIDCKRFRVTPDIISSYFWDKMIFVFNKYYGTCEEEHLKARILASLSTFKNHLLKSAYGDIAEYNQSLQQLEDLFDDSKELENTEEDDTAREEMFGMLYEYMKKHLSPDAYLVFEILCSPPPYIKERIKEGSRITNILLVEFFDMPRNKTSVRYISELRLDIDYWQNRAKEELHY